MLVLTRCPGQKLRLTTQSGEVIWLMVTDVSGNAVRLGITAPRSVTVDREEVIDRGEQNKPGPNE